MPTESAVANSLAAAGKRLESMSLLCEMLSVQLERSRREFQELKAALACSVPGHGQSGQGTPGDSSLAMLEG